MGLYEGIIDTDVFECQFLFPFLCIGCFPDVLSILQSNTDESVAVVADQPLLRFSASLLLFSSWTTRQVVIIRMRIPAQLCLIPCVYVHQASRIRLFSFLTSTRPTSMKCVSTTPKVRYDTDH